MSRRTLALFLLLPLLPLLAAWFGPSGCSARPKVLVVGIDGGDWDVMDPLIDAGYLPNLGRVVRGGARAGLSCYESLPALACFCPPVWNSIATGHSALRHNMYSLTTLSTDRRVKAIWDVLQDYGGTSTALAMRNTWPTEPGIDLNFTEEGLDFASTQIYDRWGTPPDPRAADESLHTQPPGLFQALGLLPHVGERQPVWEMYARDRVSMEALRRLARVAQTDFSFVVLHGVDKVEHLNWARIQPVQNGPFDQTALLGFASLYDGPVVGPAPWSFGSVTSQYQEADAWLGRLLRRTHYDYVMLVSDHGMGRNPRPGFAGQHGTDNPEAHIGIFAVSGPGIRRGDLGVVSVFDVAPTLAYLLELPVGDDLPGHMLAAAFWPAWLQRRPVQHVASWEPQPAAGSKRPHWGHRTRSLLLREVRSLDLRRQDAGDGAEAAVAHDHREGRRARDAELNGREAVAIRRRAVLGARQQRDRLVGAGPPADQADDAETPLRVEEFLVAVHDRVAGARDGDGPGRGGGAAPGAAPLLEIAETHHGAASRAAVRERAEGLGVRPHDALALDQHVRAGRVVARREDAARDVARGQNRVEVADAQPHRIDPEVRGGAGQAGLPGRSPRRLAAREQEGGCGEAQRCAAHHVRTSRALSRAM